jgi:hypothetical protein
VLSGPQAAEKAGNYVLGELADRVTDAAGNSSRVLIDTCTDYSQRKLYSEASDQLCVDDFPAAVVRARVVMTRAADGWLLSDYSVPDEQSCP